VDTSSGKALGNFLSDLKQNSTPATFQAIQLLATKPMQLAKYFCTGDIDMSQWHHYALNVDYYTHFTSPIRRYPDIIVHRLLQGAIYLDNPTDIREHKTFFATLPTTESLTVICEHCNEKKLNARKAQDASINLYLCLLLKQSNGKVEDAVVMSVGEKFISVVLPYYADEKRVYLEDLDIASFQYTAETKSLVLEWPAVPEDKEAKPTIAQTLTTLSPIKVKLTTKPNKFPMDIRVTILHPSTL
jgi:DIS3-like exonuclease 2